ALSRASGGRSKEWAAEVVTRLTRLQEAFAQHVVATEAPDGLFAEIIAHAPRLSRRVEQLRSEHTAIGELVAAAMAKATSSEESEVARLREDILDLLGRISRHRHLGPEPGYEAYTVDIEAAD